MVKIDKLTQLSGNKFYSEELRLDFRPPTLRDIVYLGVEVFWKMQALINFDKKSLATVEGISQETLEKTKNFDWIYSFVNNDKKTEENLRNYFLLFFPNYEILLYQKNLAQFVLKKGEEVHIIDSTNFDLFKETIIKLTSIKDEEEDIFVDEKNEAAMRIRKKLLEARKKRSEKKNVSQEEQASILANSISTLATGLGVTLNQIYDLTLPQFFEQLKRFQRKVSHEEGFSAVLAGASGIEVEDWYS